MKYYEDFSDARTKEGCVFCHSHSETKDHIPSKNFLDKPYPESLFAVPACKKCNVSFSLDEEYVATFIEWLKSMQNGTGEIERANIEKTLQHSAKLEDRLFASLKLDDNNQPYIQPEHSRIENVIKKHAIGLVYYELGERCFEPQYQITYKPLYLMNEQEVKEFNEPLKSSCYPEVGSRFMQRERNDDDGWFTIQENNFRYYIGINPHIIIRMVFQEFLCCQVLIIPK